MYSTYLPSQGMAVCLSPHCNGLNDYLTNTITLELELRVPGHGASSSATPGCPVMELPPAPPNYMDTIHMSAGLIRIQTNNISSKHTSRNLGYYPILVAIVMYDVTGS